MNIRKSLMDGTADFARYFRVGAEAIPFQMGELGYEPSDILSIPTIKRIIKRNKLRVNIPKRYKRVRFKGRYTILNPEHMIEEFNKGFDKRFWK